PFTAAPLVPTLAVAPSKPPEARSSSRVEVRVLGQRLVPEGLVRVLTDGARGSARTLLVRARDVDQPTAKPAARVPWYERAWLLRPFTPGRLWSPDPAMVIAFPDIEARRRMTRRERLAWGGGGDGTGSGPRGSGSAASAPVLSLRPDRASAPVVSSSPIAGPATVACDHAESAAVAVAAPDRAAQGEALRAELAAALVGTTAGVPPQLRAKVDDAAAALPLDMLEVLARAWGGFRARRRGS